MANIFNVARYILRKQDNMSTWKLQKLCYYAQAWSLAWTEQPLFEEDFQAWANGPVAPVLFAQHRGKFSVSESDFPSNLESLPNLTEDEKDTPFAQGVELVYKQLLTSFDELGVKPIEAVGKEFDPNLHNAVMMVDDDSLESGTVAEEMQKGYMYKESVVRHSMVKVVN